MAHGRAYAVNRLTVAALAAHDSPKRFSRMSLAAPIPEIPASPAHIRSIPTAEAGTWFEVRPQDLAVWNDALLGAGASLYQFPFWNEPYRPLWVTPHYLAWGTHDRPVAFVSILTIGFGSWKIGLVFRGPACLQPSEPFCVEAVAGLIAWARANGYIFIRFTHSDPQVLSQLAASGHSENLDMFPFFQDYATLSPEYIIHQSSEDEPTLASFDREVRRKIRRAIEAGYEFRAQDSPEALAAVWPIFQDCARRKQFRLERPLSFYLQTIRLAQPHNCVRLYSVLFGGRVVGSALVFRDGAEAHCQLAALEAQHRQAAVFLHWHAMRDMYRQGASRYNLGPGPGSLARFKRQFCQNPVHYPGPLTVVLNNGLFQIWRKALFPVARRLRPALRRIVSNVKR